MISKNITINRSPKSTFFVLPNLVISVIIFLPFITLSLSNISEENSVKLLIPKNPKITKTDVRDCSNYFDLIRVIREIRGQKIFTFNTTRSTAICSDLKTNLTNYFSANSESFLLNQKYYKFDDVKKVDSLIIVLSDYHFLKNKNNDDLSNYFFSFLPDLSIDTYESDYRFGLSISFTDIVNTLTDIQRSEIEIKNSNRDLFVESRELIANYIYQLINYFKELEMLNFEITTETDILEAMQNEFLDTSGNVSFQELNSQKINMKNLELRFFNLNNNIKLEIFKFKSLLGFR